MLLKTRFAMDEVAALQNIKKLGVSNTILSLNCLERGITKRAREDCYMDLTVPCPVQKLYC